jgi:hypothetical protein
MLGQIDIGLNISSLGYLINTSICNKSMSQFIFCYTIENNDLEKLEELLKSGDYDVNEQDVRGRSILHCLLMKDLFSDLKEMLGQIDIDLNISSLGNLINTSIYAINQCHNLYSVILY